MDIYKMRVVLSLITYMIAFKTYFCDEIFFRKSTPLYTRSLIPSGVQITRHLLNQIEKTKPASTSSLLIINSTTAPYLGQDFTEVVVSANIFVSDQIEQNDKLIIGSHGKDYEKEINSKKTDVSFDFPTNNNNSCENQLRILQGILLIESKIQGLDKIQGFSKATLEFLALASKASKTGFEQLKIILRKIIERNDLKQNDSRRFILDLLNEMSKSKSPLKEMLMKKKPLIYSVHL